ncbi:MAG: hypothetical protein U0414_27210 [Polyangiaceae bacterium]
MSALRTSERTGQADATFGGTDACTGYDGSGQRCDLSLQYRAKAKFTLRTAEPFRFSRRRGWWVRSMD